MTGPPSVALPITTGFEFPMCGQERTWESLLKPLKIRLQEKGSNGGRYPDLVHCLGMDFGAEEAATGIGFPLCREMLGSFVVVVVVGSNTFLLRLVIVCIS